MGQTATGAVAITGSEAANVLVSQTASGALAVQASASQPIAVGQTASGALAIQATASQVVEIGQNASASLSTPIVGDGASTVLIFQTASGSLSTLAEEIPPGAFIGRAQKRKRREQKDLADLMRILEAMYGKAA